MSKIKTTKLEPRSEEGTLTIGAEPGTTQFEGTVIIPGYATKDYVQGIVSGDIAVELDAYQNRLERNAVDGYAGLDGTGRVPANRVDSDVISTGITLLNSAVNQNAAKIEQLEEASTFQIEYYVDNLDGSDPGDSKMGLNAPLWKDTTEIKLNKIDGNNHEHNFTSIHAGDKIWFSDADDEDDDLGMYTVLSYSVGPEVTTFVVDLDSGKGGPSVGDKIEAEVFPAFDISAKADITYVDAQDNSIKSDYVPRYGGMDHKMTGKLYMGEHNIEGLADPDRTTDATNKRYVDAEITKIINRPPGLPFKYTTGTSAQISAKFFQWFTDGADKIRISRENSDGIRWKNEGPTNDESFAGRDDPFTIYYWNGTSKIWNIKKHGTISRIDWHSADILCYVYTLEEPNTDFARDDVYYITIAGIF